MESKTKKFVLYKVRNFSEKFDDTFAFVRENWKVLLKYLTYLILPVCLVQAIALNGYMETAFSMSDLGSGKAADVTNFIMKMGWSYGGLILTSLLAGVLLASLCYALIRLAADSENGLADITVDDLKPLLLRNLKRIGLALLFFIGALFGFMLVAALLVVITRWLLIPVFIALIAVTIPLALFTPIYLLEDTPLLQAVRKSLRLGFDTWWSTFAILLVLGFIVSFVQGIFAIPYYIMIVVKTVMGLQSSGSEFFDSVGYSFTTYLFGVLQSYATYALTSLMVVGLALQYGYAAEKNDHVTMADNIDRFEEL